MSLLYDRQKALDIDTSMSLTIIGCGGIGFHAAKMFAMSGIKTLYLYDPDSFEEHNFNRIDLPLSFIGKNKAEATALVVKTLRSDCFVKHYPFKFSDMFWTKTDWIVDCTDTIAAQERNQDIALRHGSRYVKAGYDGLHISINDRVAEWGVAEDGYTIFPSWIVPASVVAAMVVAKVMKFKNKELSCNIDKLFVIS